MPVHACTCLEQASWRLCDSGPQQHLGVRLRRATARFQGLGVLSLDSSEGKCDVKKEDILLERKRKASERASKEKPKPE